MAQFHQLKVTDLQKTIRDAVIVTLEPQIEANFDFVQGQYLTFRRDFEGQELRRSYSICSGTLSIRYFKVLTLAFRVAAPRACEKSIRPSGYL